MNMQQSNQAATLEAAAHLQHAIDTVSELSNLIDSALIRT